MTSINHPDRVIVDAFSDSQLRTYNAGGFYNRFTTKLTRPILNAKSIKLTDAAFINSCLQLNDNSQLMFWFYIQSTSTNIRTLANLRCVRLHPSNFIPYAGYTNFVKNRYFNNVQELVVALNTAATTAGDSATYNPNFAGASITFSYDATTRKVNITPSAGNFIAPAAPDDPLVLDRLRGTSSAAFRIRMNSVNSSNTYATAPLQQYVELQSMVPRLGYAMSMNTRPSYSTAGAQYGVITQTGTPFSTALEGESPPILLGSQSINFYLAGINGGRDATNRENLLHSLPITVAPFNVANLAVVPHHTLSVPNEIYELTIELLDETGLPFMQPPNFNTTLTLAIDY